MATNIFNYDGTLLTTVADGTLDQTHASIKIPGRGYQNYGQPVIESLLWVMQNFAGTTPPDYPSAGQLWYDTTENSNVLRVWTGVEWVTAGGVVASDTAPEFGYNQGAFWYNTRDKQLNTWNGDSWDLVGPLGSKINDDPLDPPVPSNSTVEAMTVIAQEDGLPRQIWRISIGGTMLAILSKDQTFSPQSGTLTANGFNTIYPGINFNSTIANIGLSGDSTVFKSTQNNLPASDALYDMGSVSRRFNSVYGVSGVFSNGLGVNVTPSAYNFQVKGTSKLDGLLTLATGTATTPPLKFPSGRLTTDPQLGAVEFDGNNFYFSGLIGGEVRRLQPTFTVASTNSLTLYVSNTNGVDTNDGRSRSTPYRTIRRAVQYLLDNALSGYTIIVESGEYMEENPIYVPPKTSITGDNLRRVIVRPVHDHLDIFHVDVNTYFFGMTFKDHRAPAFAFAFPCSTATAVVEDDPASPYVGKVVEIKPTYSYTGYDPANPPDVFIEAPGYGVGTRATATAVVVNGAITGVTVDPTQRGAGYDFNNPPIVTVTGAGGSGTGAVLAARIADRIIGDIAVGQMIGIDIIDPGQGYVEPLSIAITGGGAVATGTVGDGVIRSYTLPVGGSGSGYTRAPWVSIKPPSSKQVVITSSPYVQNCSSITGPFDVNGRLIPITFPLPFDNDSLASGGYGDLDPNGAGAGIRIDGEVVNNDTVGGTVIRSFVADSFTQINQGGIGHLIINRGYAQFVSCFTTFSSVGYWSRSGGFANISNSVIDFGDIGVKAEGYYPIAYTDGALAENYTSGVAQIKISNPGGGYVTAPAVTVENFDSDGNIVWTGGTQATAEAVINEEGEVIAVRMLTGNLPGAGYTGTPVITIAPPTPGPDAITATGLAILNSNPVVRVRDTISKPEVGSAMLFNGQFLTVLGASNPDPSTGAWDVTLQPALVWGNAASAVAFHDISNLSTGGLALEYVGSGVTYNALPRYGGVPDPDKQVVDKNTDGELTPGVVYYVTIANDGNFRVGPYFRVNFVDGTITLGENATFELTNISSIGPFKRNGVTVGTRADEISDDPTLTHPANTSWDLTTLPTQSAVRGYFGQVNSDILPKNLDTFDLGSQLKRWQEIHGNLLTIQTATITTADSDIINTRVINIDSELVGNIASFSGEVSITGDFDVSGPSVFDGNSTFNGAIAINGNLSASGNFAINGGLTVGSAATFNSNVTINSSLFVDGAIIGTDDIIGFYASDSRLKTNMEPIQDALTKVQHLDGITFDWNSVAKESRPHRNRREAGIIAQQVEKVLPEVVTTRIDGYKAVDYDKLVPLLIEAIKELSDKVRKLEDRDR